MNDLRKQNKKRIIVNSIIVFLAISLSVNLLLYLSYKEVKFEKGSFQIQNQNIALELKKANLEIAKFKGITPQLDKAIEKASIDLQEKETKIAALLRNKKLNEKLSQQLLYEIDSIKRENLNIIDSLLVERKANKTLNNQIDLLYDKIEDLNKKLGNSALLNADNFFVQPLKKSNSGKENFTATAKRVSEFKICFDILSNQVSEKEKKEIYIRILTPDAKVLSIDDKDPLMFVHPELKTSVEYTTSEIIKFEGTKISFCTKWKNNQTLIPGLYMAEIYTSKNKLGLVTFTLR